MSYILFYHPISFSSRIARSLNVIYNLNFRLNEVNFDFNPQKDLSLYSCDIQQNLNRQIPFYLVESDTGNLSTCLSSAIALIMQKHEMPFNAVNSIMTVTTDLLFFIRPLILERFVSFFNNRKKSPDLRMMNYCRNNMRNLARSIAKKSTINSVVVPNLYWFLRDIEENKIISDTGLLEVAQSQQYFGLAQSLSSTSTTKKIV